MQESVPGVPYACRTDLFRPARDKCLFLLKNMRSVPGVPYNSHIYMCEGIYEVKVKCYKYIPPGGGVEWDR